MVGWNAGAVALSRGSLARPVPLAAVRRMRPGRRAAGVLAAVLAAGAAAAPVRAQQPQAAPGPGIVRGTVRGLDGGPIPYAVVALLPGYDLRFTDASGAFVFQNVAPAAYHLLARQVGFRPRDTTVVVVSGRTREVPLVLEHLMVRLEAIQIVASRGCTDPGPPDSTAAPDLARVFSQLDLNAERYRLLAGTYPFHFRMQRAFTNYNAQGAVVSSETDTVRYLSTAVPAYRAGQVVTWGRGRGNERGLVLDLPTLSDFADSDFQASHCFVYEGVVNDSGKPLVRFAFQPAQSIRTPDIEGYVELDSVSYQVRRALVRLTHPGRALEGLADASSNITFAELYPNVVVQTRVHSELQPFIQLGVQNQVVRYVQDQRLLNVDFLRQLPGARPSVRLAGTVFPRSGRSASAD